MKELSLNILDIAENSVKARASLIEILISETEESMEISIRDNGCGMKPDFLASVTDPFTTTRTTRAVGLGIPLFKLEAEQTGGFLTVSSRHEETHPEDHGTETTAFFHKKHIDMIPLGDVSATLVTLIQGNPDIDFFFQHEAPEGSVSLDTRELREILGDVPLNNPEVLSWISGSLEEQYAERTN